jgi:hypothetical protein
MAGEYLLFSYLRPGSAAEFAAGLELPDSLVGTDAAITSTIARMSQRFDDLTGDHFSTQTPVTLTLSGNGSRILDLPRRTTALTSVSITDYAGTSTVQAAGVDRLHSSLNSAGSAWTSPGSLDWIEITPNNFLAGASFGLGYGWPAEPNSVTVVGTFGWTVTPTDVKRAVALMVYDHFKPVADPLRRTIAWASGDAQFSRDQSKPTGLPEVDQIISDYSRSLPAMVG